MFPVSGWAFALCISKSTMGMYVSPTLRSVSLLPVLSPLSLCSGGQAMLRELRYASGRDMWIITASSSSFRRTRGIEGVAMDGVIVLGGFFVGLGFCNWCWGWDSAGFDGGRTLRMCGRTRAVTRAPS